MEPEDYSYETFVAQLRNPKTRDIRARGLREWVDWLDAEGIDVLAVQAADVTRYVDLQRERRAASTSVTILRSIRAYHRWLEERGFIVRNPAAYVKDDVIRRAQPKYVPPEDVRRMLDASLTDRNWAFIAILAFNSLTCGELLACDVSDFQRRGSRYVLHFTPGGEGRRRPNYAVLDPAVVDALKRQLDGRRTGPLFLSSTGRRMDRTTAAGGIVTASANRAGLPYKVTPELLRNSLPMAALQRGFSYRGIARAMGLPDRRYSERWIGAVEGLEEDNASVRFARLVLNPPDTPENMLLHAEAVLYETDLPEPFSVAVAGSILERHLRLLADEHGVAPANDETRGNIGYYVGELQRRKVINVTDGRRLLALGDLRNHAAHGWFERVPTGSGPSVLREARELIERYPLASSEG